MVSIGNYFSFLGRQVSYKWYLWAMKISPKTLFLIDGAGALLTALLVGIVLPRLTEVGIPNGNLHLLSVAGLGLAFYSFSCHFWARNQASIALAFVAWANTAYCIITIALMYFFAQSLSALAWVYFVGELAIVGALVYVEFKTAQAHRLK